MRIARIEAIPLRIPRDIDNASGMAGSPTALGGRGQYRWSKVYPALYSIHAESALVKIVTDTGLVGWGECQAPIAPQVVCAIIHHLLQPVLIGEELPVNLRAIQSLWERLYNTMRVRGQTGGFMLDAISGVDLAIWDLVGKWKAKPVCDLIRGDSKTKVPVYLSGVTGSGVHEQVDFALSYRDRGVRDFKIYFNDSRDALLRLLDALQKRLSNTGRVAVDALWRLELHSALSFGSELDQRGVSWLECPLMPEDPIAHGQLARELKTPLALGESYRTHWEMAPFFSARALRIVQPDLGRSGITEALRIARHAEAEGVAVIPHVSIALGPQLAAAIHFAAAVQDCRLCEFNPDIFDIANRFLKSPLQVSDGNYQVPQSAGLGIEINEEDLHPYRIPAS